MNMQYNYIMQRVNQTSSNVDIGGGIMQEPWALNGYGGSPEQLQCSFDTITAIVEVAGRSIGHHQCNGGQWLVLDRQAVPGSDGLSRHSPCCSQ